MKIASQIRLTSLGLVLGTAALIGMVVYWGFYTLVQSQQREGLEKVVGLEIERLTTAFSEIQHDIRFLADIPGISTILQSHRSEEFSGEIHEHANLAALFKEILKTKPHYDQIRLIGIADQGKEIIRVERKPDGIRIVKESDLQQKGTHDYFTETLQNPPGRVYFSKINLNREHGIIEKPYRPTLRAALPIYQATETLLGIVVINMNFTTFIDELFHTQAGRYTYFLTNPNGDFLIHPEHSHTFGFEFGKSFLAQDEYPILRPLYVTTGQEFVTHWQDHSFFNPILIHFRKAKIFPDDPKRFLMFGVSASFRDVQANANIIMLKVLGITLCLIFTGLALTFSLTTRLTKPLEWLTDSTNRFAKGLDIPSRPTDAKNEIGLLSLAFDRMVASINQKENQVASMNRRLLKANADLAHFVHMASHDLREPARRMITLADLICHEGKEGMSSECQDLLIQIQSASKNLLDQATDFRVFTNLNQGNILRTNVNMADLIRSLTEEYAYAFRTKEAAMTIAPLPVLHVYENLVKAFYKNLLDHTLKHIRSNDIMLSFTAERSTDEWVLGIMVTSPSIDQNKLARVLAPLNQATSWSSESGLDLAVCKRIIERHSGQIWVDMEEEVAHIRFTFGKEASRNEHHDHDK
ncbi:MAG: ATP-binding protein [Nitrospirales bacterium]